MRIPGQTREGKKRKGELITKNGRHSRSKVNLGRRRKNIIAPEGQAASSEIEIHKWGSESANHSLDHSREETDEKVQG